MLLTERSVSKKNSQNILFKPEIELNSAVQLYSVPSPFFPFLRVAIRAA
jgi:hypothetical protein